MEAGKQTASMEAWDAIPAPEQVEIVIKAAKRAAYIAGAYGMVLTVNEIMGATWEGTVKRLDADRLCKANAKRADEGKAPLTIGQIAFRAAHSAAELDRYDRNKHNALPLETWEAVDGGNMEDQIITRLTLEGFAVGRDTVDKLIIEMLPQGYTERQIGVPTDMTGPTIHKRIVKIRDGLRREIA